jgi:hypothetical protein
MLGLPLSLSPCSAGQRERDKHTLFTSQREKERERVRKREGERVRKRESEKEGGREREEAYEF